MSRPARVPDPNDARERTPIGEPLCEAREFTFGFRTREAAARVDHRDAGAVVAAILQAAQRVQNDRNAIARPDVTDYPTHIVSIFTMRCFNAREG
jgi:hypothetical protein